MLVAGIDFKICYGVFLAIFELKNNYKLFVFNTGSKKLQAKKTQF